MPIRLFVWRYLPWLLMSGMSIALIVNAWRIDRWLFVNGDQPYPHDFGILYAAGITAATGSAPMAYDDPFLTRLTNILFDGQQTSAMFYYYPPHHLMGLQFLSGLEFLVAAAIFVLGGLLAYVAALRLVLGEWRLAIAGALASGGAFYTLLFLQHGFLIAALFIAAMALAATHPRWSGLLLGILTIKPHVGVLIPVALALRRHWQVIFWAIGSTLGLLLLATIVLGPAVWPAFFGKSFLAVDHVRTGENAGIFFSLYSRYAPIIGEASALALHLAVAAMAALAALDCWRREGVVLPVRLAALAAAALLLPPYLWHYDSVLLGGAALILWHHHEDGQALPIIDRFLVLGGALVTFMPIFIGNLTIPLSASMIAIAAWRASRRVPAA